MKVLLFGKNGQLGHVLYEKLHKQYDVLSCTKDDLDFLNRERIAETIDSFAPDVIVNAAAFTAVESAELNKTKAHKINCKAVETIARKGLKNDCLVIHYSTDYVFDGTKDSPYNETDLPNPLNYYGKSKLEGEQALINSGARYIIFRTSWVIGQHGNNFAKSIFNAFKTKDQVTIVDDQIGAPTTPNLIAEVTAKCIGALAQGQIWDSGIYNLSSRGKTTWYDIALLVHELAKKHATANLISKDNILAIPSFKFKSNAKRPSYSLLSLKKTEHQIGQPLPEWENELRPVLESIILESKPYEA